MLNLGYLHFAAMVELVDTPDSKSCVLRDVPVQVRLAVPKITLRQEGYFLIEAYLLL